VSDLGVEEMRWDRPDGIWEKREGRICSFVAEEMMV
jgi:hypothetical protein